MASLVPSTPEASTLFLLHSELASAGMEDWDVERISVQAEAVLEKLSCLPKPQLTEEDGGSSRDRSTR